MTPPAVPRSIRRWIAAVLAASVAGCAGPLPAPVWLRLPSDADVPPARVAGAAPAGTTWRLVEPVVVAGPLDRSALMRAADGGLVVTADPTLRWAEPLRDVLPRLLRHDLAAAAGVAVVAAAGGTRAPVDRELRVEILAFDLDTAARRSRLTARLQVTDRPGAAPRETTLAVATELSGLEPAAVARAHRQAVARLAERIAAFAGS